MRPYQMFMYFWNSIFGMAFDFTNKNLKQSMRQAKHIFTLLFLFFISAIHGQSEVIVNPPDHIKSIVLRSQNTNDYSPIIRLGGRLMLSFDDLEGDQKQYTYSIEHYDYQWEKSQLNPTEYLDGFTNDWIRDFESSFNTIQPYTHYKLRLPNDNLRITASGNYVLSVFDEDGAIVFTRPFMVFDPKVDVGVSVHRSRDIATINTKQNVQFSVNHPNIRVNNPNLEFKVVVYQNLDWNTAIRDIQPQFIRGNQILYKYGANVTYWGGNEFLFFDTKQIRGAVNNIAKSELDGEFQTYLYTDEERKNRPYTFYPDINGNFVLRTIDTESIDTEGDYSWVHFSLETDRFVDEAPIYVYGKFNDWQLTESNRLVYNPKTRLYEASIQFKQGFYNYSYLIKDDEGTLDNYSIDGSFVQTENTYYVMVYYKPLASRFYQLVGIGSANSENLRN